MRKINYILIGLFLIVSWSFEGHAQTNDTVAKEAESNKKTEIAPEFIGGEKARQKFLAYNIKYPKKAYERGIQGTVVVAFIIEPDGSITDVVVYKSVHKLLDAEAVRVTKLMPKWKPGTQDGEPVRVHFRMPINFKLN